MEKAKRDRPKKENNCNDVCRVSQVNLKVTYGNCAAKSCVNIFKPNEDMILALLDNLSNCLSNLKNSGDSTGFEPMTSAMPVHETIA